jgi:hypothetical protein
MVANKTYQLLIPANYTVTSGCGDVTMTSSAFQLAGNSSLFNITAAPPITPGVNAFSIQSQPCNITIQGRDAWTVEFITDDRWNPNPSQQVDTTSISIRLGRV